MPSELEQSASVDNRIPSRVFERWPGNFVVIRIEQYVQLYARHDSDAIRWWRSREAASQWIAKQPDLREV